MRPPQAQHRVPPRGVKDVGGFTQGTQGGGGDAEALLHFGAGGRLLQATQAGDDWVQDVEQPSAGLLMVTQVPIAGAVPLCRREAEVVQERAQEAKIVAPWEGLLGQHGREAESHVDVLLSCKRGRCLYELRMILSYIALF